MTLHSFLNTVRQCIDSRSITCLVAVSASATSSLAAVTPSATLSTGASASASLSVSVSPSSTPTPTPSVAAAVDGTVAANILVIAKDATTAGVVASGLNGYGIPFTSLVVPQAGVALPALNGTNGGNFGGIVIDSEVSYDYGGTQGYQSALTTDQWNQLYAYQLQYGVRMVQFNVYPGPNFGATALDGGCCATGVEQLVSFSDISDFPTAGLRAGAGVSTQGLWHYGASISNTSTTKEIAQFAVGGDITSVSTAAVINNFSGRQQMAFFIGFSQDWSPTSAYLQHAWIHWMTRGLYAGYRRVNLITQVDDMFLETDIYYPANNSTFRIRSADMATIATWVDDIQATLNIGSQYFPEICHNGNGNIEASASTTAGETACGEGPIEYDEVPDPPLEYKKPLGTGTNRWPTTPTTFDWTDTCINMDSLKIWWATTANRDKFAHISHTFTHLELNNATYADAAKEIAFNQAWLQRASISSAARFSSKALVPPAITGLHNGDVLQAWHDNGLTNCVGDNTRPPLRNQQNDHYPYITTVDADGYAGFQVNPRWATRIYYNCDTPACTTQEWIDTSAGVGDFYDLLDTEKADTTRHLMGLYRDPYMFHQANLRVTDVPETTINGVTKKRALMQAWVETVVAEFVRLVDWPVISIKHDDMSDAFSARVARDACKYSLSWTTASQKITGVTLSATGNTCSSPIPVTFPVAPTSTQGFTTEQVGNDPLTVWVQLSGSPVHFTLSTPVSW